MRQSLTSKLLRGAKAALDVYLDGHDEDARAAEVDVTPPTPRPPPGAAPFAPAGDRGPDLRQAAIEARVEVVPLPADKTGMRWDIADKQLQYEAKFAAFCMAWWNAEAPAADLGELQRRALIAASVFHNVPIEDLPLHLREKTGE